MCAAKFAVLPVIVILTYLPVVWAKESVTMLFPVFVGSTVFQFEPSVETWI